MQKYRADYCEMNSDGSVSWYCRWVGGPTLAKIGKCACDDGERHMVYITSEPDTFFSIPAATRVNGHYVSGFVSGSPLAFTACDKRKHVSRDYSIMVSAIREKAETARLFLNSVDIFNESRLRGLAFAGFDYGDSPEY